MIDWKEDFKTSLGESVLIGYPIPTGNEHICKWAMLSGLNMLYLYVHLCVKENESNEN